MKKILYTVLTLVVVAAAALSVLFVRADTEISVLDDDARGAASGQFLELSDGVTHYELGGPDDGDGVVLVHGFSVPYYIWDTTFDALNQAGFRVLRYDIFGRGYSDRPNIAYDGELFERQVLELIDRLELEAPVDLIGLSMGGAIVMRVAANNPESVRRIVLVDPLHVASEPPPMPRTIGEYTLAVRLIPNLAEGQMTDFLYPENYPTWVDLYREQMRYEGFRQAIISTVYEFLTEDHLKMFKKVGATDIPVKLIWGVEDRTLDISGAEIVKSVVDVDFMPVEESGHLPHIEQAELVNAAIIDFLQTNAPGDR